MSNKRILSLLGICRKAGKLSSGEFGAETAVKSGHSHLVIISEEASDNTSGKFFNMCSYYHVKIRRYADKATLGGCIGQQERAVLSINDRGLAEVLIRLLDANMSPSSNSPEQEIQDR